MKIFHLSDLHLGKRVNGFSMIEDQAYIIKRILEAADREKPQAVIIAGDIYDRNVPPQEAVTLFDEFITELWKRGIKVLAISGNHDSAERIAFGYRQMEKTGIWFSPVYSGKVSPVVLEDEYGEVCFWLLPFIKPAHAARFSEHEIKTYNDAVKAAVSSMDMDVSKRNVLVTHQFITGSKVCESEEISIGGADNVDAEVFKDFDYTALGHLHGPQYAGADNVRYCGSPLKYSFSEKDQEKSVTVLELYEKGNMTVRTAALVPLRDLREIKGAYEELAFRGSYEGTNTLDYIHAVLTDEDDIPDAAGRLRTIYPNLMKLSYDNTRTRNLESVGSCVNMEKRSAEELFTDFFEKQNGIKPCGGQDDIIRKIFEEAKEACG